MTANKLENLLNSNENGDLASVVKRAQRMGELTRALCNALPAAERDGIVAANVRDGGELVVICVSPAWAAKLRFETALLMDAARRAGVEPTSCRVRTSAS